MLPLFKSTSSTKKSILLKLDIWLSLIVIISPAVKPCELFVVINVYDSFSLVIYLLKLMMLDGVSIISSNKPKAASPDPDMSTLFRLSIYNLNIIKIDFDNFHKLIDKNISINSPKPIFPRID